MLHNLQLCNAPLQCAADPIQVARASGRLQHRINVVHGRSKFTGKFTVIQHLAVHLASICRNEYFSKYYLVVSL